MPIANGIERVKAVSPFFSCMASPFFPDARLARSVLLPTSPHRIHHYINLTNGLEAVPRLVEHIPPSNIGFVRWQVRVCMSWWFQADGEKNGNVGGDPDLRFPPFNSTHDPIACTMTTVVPL